MGAASSTSGGSNSGNGAGETPRPAAAAAVAPAPSVVTGSIVKSYSNNELPENERLLKKAPAASFSMKRSVSHYQVAPLDEVDVNMITETEHMIRITLPLILKSDKSEVTRRKTKIICTMGPKCSSEEMLSVLLDGGMNVARFNFSHGTHATHQPVLDLYRKICAQKGLRAAALLDTKGSEIRTSILKDHKPINLEKDQEIIIVACGDPGYTTFEGYKNDKETRIGLSYAKLCQSVKKGNKMLLADGSVTIEVMEILNDKELKGKVLNSKSLGERKNCNLPGIHVQLPVLAAQDIDDLQNFCCKNKMDYVAASFVQSGADVQFIRRILDEAGGKHVKIISKIENHAGVQNFDDILKYTDGIMVARGDLGMEIEPAKVPLAQKLMLTRCNMQGKFVVVATQMLESMIESPRPTRAEMTDVANAVLDGADCVMLSGETANGDFPKEAVTTMAAIVANAEVCMDYDAQFTFIRDYNAGARDVTLEEACLCNVAKTAVDIVEDKYSADVDQEAGELCIVYTEDGSAANLVSKYRPPCPVVVVSMSEEVLRLTNTWFGQYPFKPSSFATTLEVISEIMAYAVKTGLALPGKKCILARGVKSASADSSPVISILTIPGTTERAGTPGKSLRAPGLPAAGMTRSLRATKISVSLVLAPATNMRQTKIICTMGPKSWSEEGLGRLLDGGMDIARFNLSHGKHADHIEVLQRLRKVCGEKRAAFLARTGLDAGAPVWASMLDTKGPEIRTAMLKDHVSIQLDAGQDIIVEAVGADYINFEGYKNETETRIGLSYGKLCQSVKPGNRILLADGVISIEVVEILNDRELKGKVLNSKKLGETKNCNLPGVHVDLPVLADKDIDDLQNLCCKHKMQYVAASFVQSGTDVLFIRKVLDDAGGKDVQIISKIENEAGLKNFDDILKHTDGIMIARGDLGMEIPPEKVALAQMYMTTKCNIAGKFVVTATQMLESMITNPRPTRAEMTDVANAVINGTDCVMLSGETANGDFSYEAVSTMASIALNAEVGIWHYSVHKFIREHSTRPFSTLESVASTAAQICLDLHAGLMIVLSSEGLVANIVSKYKPVVPVLVVTTSERTAHHVRSRYGQFAFLVPERTDDVPAFVLGATKMGLYCGGPVVVVKGWRVEQGADFEATVEVVHV